MDSLISGEAGVALLIDGAALRSLGLGAAAQPVHRRWEDVPFLFGDARDVQVLEIVTEREVALRLESAAARVDGLQLILMLLDPTLAADTRQEAAAEAEELLAQGGTAEAVESILYAHPLPAAADPAGAFRACANRAPRARQLMSQLVARQPLVALVRQAWEQLPLAQFGTPEDRERVQAVFVREGLFRRLVLARESWQPMDTFLLGALLNSEVKDLARHRAILISWTEPFQRDRRQRQPENQRVETADVVAEAAAPSYEPDIGKQTTRFEPPDIFFLKLRGTVTWEEGAEINRRHREWGKTTERVFYLVDLAELERIDPEVRKDATSAMAEVPTRGMVGFSAPVKARVIAKLIFTALNLFSNKADRIPLHFTDTEAEARAWIEERRHKVEAEAAKAASLA
jgi:hypothetical protein